MRAALRRDAERPVVEAHAVHVQVHAVCHRRNLCFVRKQRCDLLADAVRPREVVVVPRKDDVAPRALGAHVALHADGHAVFEMEVAHARVWKHPLRVRRLRERHSAIVHDNHLVVAVIWNPRDKHSRQHGSMKLASDEAEPESATRGTRWGGEAGGHVTTHGGAAHPTARPPATSAP